MHSGPSRRHWPYMPGGEDDGIGGILALAPGRPRPNGLLHTWRCAPYRSPLHGRRRHATFGRQSSNRAQGLERFFEERIVAQPPARSASRTHSR